MKILYLAPEMVVRGSTSAPSPEAAGVEGVAGEAGGEPPAVPDGAPAKAVPLHRHARGAR